MENCIFCKIVKGEIPSTKVYEDETCFGFLDIHPVTKGHILLVPKDHIVWMQDASDTVIADMFTKSKKLMRSIIHGLSCDYVQVSVVGKDVPHFHIHLFPRMLHDNLPQFPTTAYNPGEEEIFADKIRAQIL